VCADGVVEFELILPLSIGPATVRPTHVVDLRGDQRAFMLTLHDQFDQDTSLAVVEVGSVEPSDSRQGTIRHSH
jgi:hypothetical protein